MADIVTRIKITLEIEGLLNDGYLSLEGATIRLAGHDEALIILPATRIFTGETFEMPIEVS